MGTAQHSQHAEKWLRRTPFIVAKDLWRMRQNVKRRIPQLMQAEALHKRVELVLHAPPAILEIVVIKAQAGVNKTLAQPHVFSLGERPTEVGADGRHHIVLQV